MISAQNHTKLSRNKKEKYFEPLIFVLQPLSIFYVGQNSRKVEKYMILSQNCKFQTETVPLNVIGL